MIFSTKSIIFSQNNSSCLVQITGSLVAADDCIEMDASRLPPRSALPSALPFAGAGAGAGAGAEAEAGSGAGARNDGCSDEHGLLEGELVVVAENTQAICETFSLEDLTAVYCTFNGHLLLELSIEMQG